MLLESPPEILPAITVSLLAKLCCPLSLTLTLSPRLSLSLLFLPILPPKFPTLQSHQPKHKRFLATALHHTERKFKRRQASNGIPCASSGSSHLLRPPRHLHRPIPGLLPHRDAPVHHRDTSDRVIPTSRLLASSGRHAAASHPSSGLHAATSHASSRRHPAASHAPRRNAGDPTSRFHSFPDPVVDSNRGAGSIDVPVVVSIS